MEDSKPRKKNYYRLHGVYWDKAPAFLRHVFYQMWESLKNSQWQSDRAHGKELSMLINFKGKKLEKNYVENGKSSLWDLALLIKIILAMKSTLPDWENCPIDLSAYTTRNLVSLKSIRNQLAHAGINEIDDETFRRHWKNTIKILCALGMSEDMITLDLPELQSGRTPPAIDKKAWELKEAGNVCFKKRRMAEAVHLYSQAIEMEGVSEDLLALLYFNRSYAHNTMNDYESAKKDAKTTITLRPYWSKGYKQLAIAYEQAGKFSKAILNYKLAMGFYPACESMLERIEYCESMLSKC